MTDDNCLNKGNVTGLSDFKSVKQYTLKVAESELNEQTPSSEGKVFSVVSATPTSITITAQSSLNSAGVDKVSYYDKLSQIWKIISQAGDGNYTLRNLVPGVKYKFCCERRDGMWNEPEYIDAQTVVPPENLTLYSRDNIDFELDKVYTDVLGDVLTNEFLDNVDASFKTMYDLVNGTVTYKGGKMRLKHTRDLPSPAEGQPGFPITWQLYRDIKDGDGNGLAAVDHAVFMKAKGASTTEAPLHEISHNFDSDKWNFDAEALAVLKMYYHYSVTNQSMALCNQSRVFTGVEYKDYIKSYVSRKEGNVNYDRAMMENMYSPYSLAYTLCNIADIIGWDAFTNTFTYFYNLPDESVPVSKLEKFKRFLTKLEDFSGKPVFKLLTDKEKEIYGSYFGGSVGGLSCTAQGFEFYDTSSSFSEFRILARSVKYSDGSEPSQLFFWVWADSNGESSKVKHFATKIPNTRNWEVSVPRASHRNAVGGYTMSCYAVNSPEVMVEGSLKTNIIDDEEDEFDSSKTVEYALMDLQISYDKAPYDYMKEDIQVLMDAVKEAEESIEFEKRLDLAYWTNENTFKAKPNKVELILMAHKPVEAMLNASFSGAADAMSQNLYGENGADGDIRNSYKHAYWNALLAYNIGEETAKLFTDAHEYGSPTVLDTAEESSIGKNEILHTTMDLHNNAVGRSLSKPWVDISYAELMLSQRVGDAINEGKLYYINGRGEMVPTYGGDI